jgi:DNA invertase Pin-like site-specific DNA recombinase
MTKAIKAAIYLRVSTSGQTVENQRRELEAAAKARGWAVVAVFSDEGVSGSKGRADRPQLDLMLKDAVRGRFNVTLVWAVDRLGRSLPDLIATMQELKGAGVDLFIQKQSLDTTTPSGRAMFQMLGVFSEFERSMIQERVKSGLERAKASGKTLGRKPIPKATEAEIRRHLATGMGMLKVAALVGVGSGTVQRVKREMQPA